MDDTQAIITTAISSIMSLIGGSVIASYRHRLSASAQLFSQMNEWQERQAKIIEECEAKHDRCEQENRRNRNRLARLERHLGLRVSTGEEDDSSDTNHDLKIH